MKTLKITFALVALVAVFTLTVSGNSVEKSMKETRIEQKDNVDLDLIVNAKKKLKAGSQA